MALKIGDTITVTIGQPLPEGEPVDELIYTSMGYMPMSLLELRNEMQDSTTFTVKAGCPDTQTAQVIVEKVGTIAHVTEHYYIEKAGDPIKRSVHVHTYDKLDLFPEQENVN